MSHENVIVAYEKYISSEIRPLRNLIKAVFKQWEQEDFWSAERDGSQITIPSPVQRTYSRVKRLESIEDKARKQGLDIASNPDGIFGSMHDILGARVVTYVTNNIPLIDRAIQRTPEVRISPAAKPKFYLPAETMERLALDASLFEMEEVKETGYSSIHYLLEYIGDEGRKYPAFELQVRTMLIEAWGEIEHKFAYKPGTSPEVGVRRQLRIVADHLRAIDSHFDLIHDRLQYLRSVSDPDNGDMLDEVNIARIFADVQIALRDKDVVPLLGILFDNGLTAVGDLRSRVTSEIVVELRKMLALSVPPQELTAFHVVSTAVNLPDSPKPADALAVLAERLASVEASKARFRDKS